MGAQAEPSGKGSGSEGGDGTFRIPLGNENPDPDWIDLADTPVADGDLAQLKGLTNLEVLILSGTRVTDAGLAHLKELSKMKRLWLNQTRVTDAGLEHLEHLSRLERLSLLGTPITGKVVAAATAPARCAAPPAPQMRTEMPRSLALLAKACVAAGVRCADETCQS